MIEQLSIFDLPPAENPPRELFNHHRLAGIFSDCPYCGKRFYAKRGKIYCCNKCKRYALRQRNILQYGYRPDNYNDCKCGNKKSRSAKFCSDCKKTIKENSKKRPSRAVFFNKCKMCNKLFCAKQSSTKFCSNKCACDSKRQANPEKYRKLYRRSELKREQERPWLKMLKSQRRRINEVMRDARLRKKSRTFEMLGYTPEQLKSHIESQFVFGMTWDNYGSEWHVDHIKPVTWFNVKNEQDLAKIWDLSNLMPRWATNSISERYGGFMMGNIEKGNRYQGAA